MVFYQASNSFHREYALKSDHNAIFDRDITLKAEDIVPQVTWGTSPEMVVGIDGRVPNFEDMPSDTARAGLQRALEYMGLGKCFKRIKRCQRR